MEDVTRRRGFGASGDQFVTVLLLSSDAEVGATCNIISWDEK